VNILDAMKDDKVFGKHFTGDTWDTWRVFLCALFALPMLPEQVATYTRHTGRSMPPTQPLQEAWLICGRRSGKSFTLACIAVFLACFRDWRRHLTVGEVCTIMVIAADRRQARVIMRYCLGLLQAAPMLRALIQSTTRESITLSNRVVLEIHTASFRSTRGYSCGACLLDELAFFPSDETAAEPADEVINALRPSLATLPGSMLLCASSPHARRGPLWDVHSRHYGRDGDPILVWQAPTLSMNPCVPQRIIDTAIEEDPARANAEWLAQFRADVETFIAREGIEACVGDFREMLPMTGIVYCGFVDPSGGSDAAMTLAIGHKTMTPEKQVVIDAVCEARPPFDPAAVVNDFAGLCKKYRILKVLGDHYGGEFVKEPFRKHGISYEVCKTAKSDLFRDLLPLLNSRRIILPRNDRLIAQIVGLERRVSRAGKDLIAPVPHGQDDIINAVAGCAASVHKPYAPFMRCGDDDDPDGTKAWHGFRLMQHIAQYG
jgi:hypothetical protein